VQEFKVLNPDFERVIRESFGRQKIMETMGASLTHISPGKVEIELPFNNKLTQQHGFLHAGVIATVIDSACGYAALSLMPPESAVLSVEYKVNLLSPAAGEKLIAIGTVEKPGKTLIVCRGEAYSINGETKKQVAAFQGTMMVVQNRPELRG
jgi:uncharacterized protein (TIGR00369 family)